MPIIKKPLSKKGSIWRIASPTLGLYDSANGNSVTAIHMVDATKFCAKSERCVIKYAPVERGLIAQICDWYEADKDLGGMVHYHINEMKPVELAKDCVFAMKCRVMGCDALDLANFIYDNKPK